MGGGQDLWAWKLTSAGSLRGLRSLQNGPRVQIQLSSPSWEGRWIHMGVREALQRVRGLERPLQGQSRGV